MSELTVKITKTVVDNAEAPAKGDIWIWDDVLKGFGLRVQASGRKTYVVRYRTRDDQRTQRKVMVCRAGDATPDKARNLARDIFMSVAAGNDPAKERQRKPAHEDSPTVEALFKARVEYMKAKRLTHADEVERVLLLAKTNAADAIGRKRAPADVTPDDIVKFISPFYRAGHRGAADKARSYLSATFAWAIKSATDYTVEARQDWGIERNPVSDVAKDQGSVGVRERNLTPDEIRILWTACAESGPFSDGVRVCLRTILSTGQRVLETVRMDGRDIDLEAGVWRMPCEKTKTGTRDHVIPLSKHIIPDLRKLKEKHGDGPLFPARADSETGILGLISISHAVSKWLRKNEAFEKFQPRDLRRTWKSRAGDGAGIHRFWRDLIQQHAKGDTGTKNYDRADYLPMLRREMKKWDDWLGLVLEGKTPPQVQPNDEELPVAA